MYICQVCGAKSVPRQKRLLHITYRHVAKPGGGTRTEIHRETPVCVACKELLDQGHSPQAVSRLRYHEGEEVPA